GGRNDGTNGFIGLIDDFKVQGEVSLGAHDMDFNAIPSVAGDFNGNGELDANDIDLLSNEAASATPDVSFDLNNDGAVDATDRTVWVKDLKRTWIGDANLDGEFNSSDFVAVFSQGKYEDGIDDNATWAEGDWNGDMDFDSGDFVAAFTDGGFELGPLPPQVTAVPEPTTFVSLASAFLLLWCVRRR
ncbi:MAG: hypothetical protein KDA87_27505, partial [Planctomycetales bacterium]|nr:hypothetical protein [Planctomycetales bacterium]